MHSALQEQVTSLAQFFGMRSNLIIFGFNFPLSITRPSSVGRGQSGFGSTAFFQMKAW